MTNLFELSSKQNGTVKGGTSPFDQTYISGDSLLIQLTVHHDQLNSEVNMLVSVHACGFAVYFFMQHQTTIFSTQVVFQDSVKGAPLE